MAGRPWTDRDEFTFEAELPWRGVVLDAPVTGICRIDETDGTILDIWLVTIKGGTNSRHLLTEQDGELLRGCCKIVSDDYQDVIDEMVSEWREDRENRIGDARYEASRQY